MTIEIVSFPINSMVDLSIVFPLKTVDLSSSLSLHNQRLNPLNPSRSRSLVRIGRMKSLAELGGTNLREAQADRGDDLLKRHKATRSMEIMVKKNEWFMVDMSCLC